MASPLLCVNLGLVNCFCNRVDLSLPLKRVFQGLWCLEAGSGFWTTSWPTSELDSLSAYIYISVLSRQIMLIYILKKKV